MSMAALINASLASDKFDFNDLSTAVKKKQKQISQSVLYKFKQDCHVLPIFDKSPTMAC